jgi:MFS family permease
MTKVLSIPLHIAAKMTVLAVIAHNIFTAIFGWLSDKVGLQRTMFAACITQLICIYPAFILLHEHHFALFQLIMVLPAALAYSVVHPLSSLNVPVLIRGRVSGFAFSAGLSIFAGLTPLITGTLTQLMGGSATGVMIYVATTGLLGGTLLIWLLKETPAPQNKKANLRLVA